METFNSSSISYREHICLLLLQCSCNSYQTREDSVFGYVCHKYSNTFHDSKNTNLKTQGSSVYNYPVELTWFCPDYVGVQANKRATRGSLDNDNCFLQPRIAQPNKTFQPLWLVLFTVVFSYSPSLPALHILIPAKEKRRVPYQWLFRAKQSIVTPGAGG